MATSLLNPASAAEELIAAFEIAALSMQPTSHANEMRIPRPLICCAQPRANVVLDL